MAQRALGGPGRTFALSVSTERLVAPEGAGIHLMVLTGSARYVQARRYGNPPHAGIGTGTTHKISQRLTRRASVDMVPSPSVAYRKGSRPAMIPGEMRADEQYKGNCR